MLAGASLLLTGCDAQSASSGLKCDVTATMTVTDPAKSQPSVKTQNMEMVIKFADDYWRVVSQDGIAKPGDIMTPMRVTDAAYVLHEGSEETTATGVYLVGKPLTVDRKTGEYAMTMDSDMPAKPGFHTNLDMKGRCTPIKFDR